MVVQFVVNLSVQCTCVSLECLLMNVCVRSVCVRVMLKGCANCAMVVVSLLSLRMRDFACFRMGWTRVGIFLAVL